MMMAVTAVVKAQIVQTCNVRWLVPRVQTVPWFYVLVQWTRWKSRLWSEGRRVQASQWSEIAALSETDHPINQQMVIVILLLTSWLMPVTHNQEFCTRNLARFLYIPDCACHLHSSESGWLQWRTTNMHTDETDVSNRVIQNIQA